MNFFICTTKYSGNEAKRDVLGNTRGGREDQSNKAERKVNAVDSAQAALSEAPGNAKDRPVRRNWTTVRCTATRHSLQPPGLSAKENADAGHVSKECSCFTASALLRHSGKGFSAVWFPSILAGFPCVYL